MTRPNRIRVVLADNHPVYRHGLVDTIRRRPDLELMAAAEDGREALELIERLSPDVAVLDVRMPGLGGLDVLRAARRAALRVRILLLSAYFESDIVYEGLAAGAAGFLSKDSTGGVIGDAVAAVARGETVLGPDVQAAVALEIRRRAPSDVGLLSPREHQVLALTADGLAAPEIASSLHIGITTVKTHLQRAYEKLEVSDRAAAVAQAMRRGLLE